MGKRHASGLRRTVQPNFPSRQLAGANSHLLAVYCPAPLVVILCPKEFIFAGAAEGRTRALNFDGPQPVEALAGVRGEPGWNRAN
ncbi:MAG: hypothetical protein PSW75_12980 [bacterium]|nr:hypothetical protein [bacterium]MDI1337290.1 hypothetical protein [Lacunisphaera sp.]